MLKKLIILSKLCNHVQFVYIVAMIIFGRDTAHLKPYNSNFTLLLSFT